ncbi:MAG TPA: DUF2782 domain-containing protein [Pelomicrobium sp.]|nr:DUF2782 domain-containing protein [Pelomicrobium sp.]
MSSRKLLLASLAAPLVALALLSASGEAAEDRIQFDRERPGSAPLPADQDRLQAVTEPDVTIRQYDNRSEEEFRVNNNLYMIRVQPRVGAPYYLVDPNGTGSWEQSRHSLGMDFRPPQWALFRW